MKAQNDRSAGKRRLWTILRILFAALICIGIGAHVRKYFEGVQPSELLPPLKFLFAAIAASILSQILSAGIWWYLTIRYDCSTGPKVALGVWCNSALGKYVPTKALLPAIRFYHYQALNVPARAMKLSFAMVDETLGAVATGLIIVALATPAPEWQRIMPSTATALFIAIVAGTAIAALLSRSFLFRTVVSRYKLPSTTPPQTWKLVPALFFLCSLVWVVQGAMVFVLAAGYVPLPGSEFWRVTAAYALAGTAGILVIVAPSGIGVREGVLIGALSGVMPVKTATMVAIMARLVAVATELLLAAVTRIWLPMRGHDQASAASNTFPTC